MIQFNLKNKDYLLVEVPSNITFWEILDNTLGNYITKALNLNQQFLSYGKFKESDKLVTVQFSTNSDNFYLPKGKWNIINKLSEVLQNEKLCSDIVEQHNSFFWKVPRFYNYLKYPKVNINELLKSIPYDNLFEFFKATDSFKSFLQSINVDMSKEYLLISKQ